MEARNITNDFTIEGRIDKKVYDVDDLKSEVDDYHSLSKKGKLRVAEDVEPEDEETVYNVTTDRFHEYIVDNLDPNQSASKDNVTVAWLGLGTNSGGGVATSDTDLNNRTYSETVTDVTDNTKDILASTFVDSTEGNGNTFNELGLFTGDPSTLGNNDVFLLNHATFSDVTKDNTKTVTFDVTLTFSDT